MKKFLSICLVLVMMLSVFAVPVSAESGLVVFSGYYDGQYNDLLFTVDEYDMTATIVGYVLRDSNSPSGSKAIPTSVVYKNKYYEVIGIDYLAFYQSMYTKISVPSTVTYIGSNAFASSLYLEDVEIDENCELYYVGSSLFMGTPYEAEIYENKATYLGKNVLYKYNGDGEFTIPDNITIIAPQAFMWSDVEKVVFNDNIDEIPDYCFASCWSLTDVVMTDSIYYIGNGAFKDCTSLEKITLGKNVELLGTDCFANTKLKTIHLGEYVYEMTGAFNNCKTMESITVDANNETYTTDGKAVYSKMYFEIEEAYQLDYYIPSQAQGTVTLNDDVISIGMYAFYNCDGLEKVKGNQVYLVMSYAFSGSGIKEFDADNLTIIGNGAFRNCKKLDTINLENIYYFAEASFENCVSLTKVDFADDVSEIGGAAFANTGITEVTIKGDDCYIYESAFMNCKNLETVKLEEGVSYVGMNAFLNCPKLKVIYLSKTVNYFEDNAFNGCDDVTFELIKGTKAYKFIKRNTDFNFEIVGNYSFFQRIIDFFRSIFR